MQMRVLDYKNILRFAANSPRPLSLLICPSDNWQIEKKNNNTRAKP